MMQEEEEVKKTFWQRNNPVAWTGPLLHALHWTTASMEDQFVPNPSYKGKKGEGVVVFCVHGTADRENAFAKVTRRLTRDHDLPEDIEGFYRLSFAGRFTGLPIEALTEQLAKKIELYGHKKIILFGHSRGGLVCAEYAQNSEEYREKIAESQQKDKKKSEMSGGEDKVKVMAVFEFCAPHGGSYLALSPITFFSSSVKEMAIGSKYLENLNKDIVSNPKSKYFFIEAKADYIVGKGCSYIDEYVKKHPNSLMQVKTKHTHLSILSTREGLEPVAENLKDLFTEKKCEIKEHKESYEVDSSSESESEIYSP